jgi:hypothetical protein
LLESVGGHVAIHTNFSLSSIVMPVLDTVQPSDGNDVVIRNNGTPPEDVSCAEIQALALGLETCADNDFDVTDGDDATCAITCG